MSVLTQRTEEIKNVPAQAPAAEPALTVLRPPSGWQLINFLELWQFRDLLYFLAWRDIKVRYKQTLLGAAWAILQPALMMVVFTIFFSLGKKTEDLPANYPLFVYAGLLPWTFFATALTSAGNSVVGSERLITKIYFPRLAVPFAAVGAAVVDLAVSFSLLLVLMPLYHVWPGWGVLWLLPLVALLVLAAAGVGTMLAALNVAYRDFRYVMPFLVQLWMFATPTIYLDVFHAGAPGSALHTLLALNPMTGLIAAFRAALLGGDMPWDMLAVSAVAAPCVFLAGCFYFRRVEDSFADVI